MAENNESDTGPINNTGSTPTSNATTDTATPHRVPVLPSSDTTPAPSSPPPVLPSNSDTTAPDELVDGHQCSRRLVQVLVMRAGGSYDVTRQRILVPTDGEGTDEEETDDEDDDDDDIYDDAPHWDINPRSTDTEYPFEEDDRIYHQRTPLPSHSRLLPPLLPPTVRTELFASSTANTSTTGAGGEPHAVRQSSRVVDEPATERPQRPHRAIITVNAPSAGRARRLARDRRHLNTSIIRRSHIPVAPLAEAAVPGRLVPDEATPPGPAPVASGSGGAGRWQCVRCDSVFDTAAQLRRHRTAVHFTIPGKAFSCFKCSRKLV